MVGLLVRNLPESCLEEKDDGQEEGWTRGGRHSENGGGVDKVRH